MPAKSEITVAARALLRRAFKGSLASVDAGNDYPYASLINLGDGHGGRANLPHLEARPPHH